MQEQAKDPGATETLAHYVAQLSYDDVPREVIQRMSLLVLDQLGCQIVGTQLPWSKQIFDVMRLVTAPGPCTVVQHEEMLAADGAAFMNSALGHSNESDDTHLLSPTHPGAVIIPAAIAMAEMAEASGSRLLESLVVGYEVMLRISNAVSPYLIARGHHPPVAVGPFGAAAAAARILGLDEKLTLNALAISGSFSAGLQEYTQTGGSVKRLHCAIPAQAGVRAALLAQAGVTGPPTVLEGKRGFCQVFAGEYDERRLTADLGSAYVTMDTAFKSYSCCYLIHPALDAIRNMQKTRPFQARDVQAISVFTHLQSLVQHVGVIVEPPDILAAQFSMGFSIGLLLVDGECGFWNYFNADLRDPIILEVSRRTTTSVADPDAHLFNTGLSVRVELTDGSVLTESIEHARGEPQNPLSDGELQEKFVRMSTPVVGSEVTQQITEIVSDLSQLPDVRHLTGLLGSQGS